jgi:hypothetical protein
MPSLRSPWINAAAALVGLAAFLRGIYLLVQAVTLYGFLWTVMGFLVLGWAYFDRRKFLRGTPESEVDGGRTIE